MKTSVSIANDGFCPECHNELTNDLSAKGFVRHKDSKFRLDRRGGIVVLDERGQPIPCTLGRGERDDNSRNPNWTRDEVILALELYFRVNPLTTSESNPEIVALSELLNKLPIHTDRPDAQKFRNPNGVYMKLCNLLRFDPDYDGVGLTAGGKIEETIWKEFADDKPRLTIVAEAIRAAAGIPRNQWDDARDESDLDEAAEGKVLTRLHKVRERNRELVRRKKAKSLEQNGCLACEVCSFDFTAVYGDLGEGYIECHHTLPLSLLAPGEKTRLSDLALVCANCHRILHRGLKWLSVTELRAILDERRVKP